MFWQPQKVSRGPLSDTPSPDAQHEIITSRGLQTWQKSWPVTVIAARCAVHLQAAPNNAGSARQLPREQPANWQQDALAQAST